jgi:hypothetical protein
MTNKEFQEMLKFYPDEWIVVVRSWPAAYALARTPQRVWLVAMPEHHGYEDGTGDESFPAVLLDS